MGIGKYVTNPGIWGALAGSIGLARKHKRGPADWRGFVPWIVWVLGVVVAIANVAMAENSEVEDSEDAAPTSAARKKLRG